MKYAITARRPYTIIASHMGIALRPSCSTLGWLTMACIVLISASPERAHAQITIGEAYDEIASVIEDLIQGEVGDQVADRLERIPLLNGRYFSGTVERLRSSYWGSLETTVRLEVVELAVDYAYWASRYPDRVQDFFRCGHSANDRTRGCTGEFLNKEKAAVRLVPTHCGVRPTAEDFVACDVAKAFGATLAGDKELLRTYSELLIADLWLTRVAAQGTLSSAMFADHRRRVRGWLQEPNELKRAMDTIRQGAGVEIAQLYTVDMDCTQQSPDLIGLNKFSARRCLERSFDAGTKGSSYAAVPVMKIRVTSPSSVREYTMTLGELRAHVASARAAEPSAELEAVAVLARKVVYAKLHAAALAAASDQALPSEEEVARSQGAATKARADLDAIEAELSAAKLAEEQVQVTLDKMRSLRPDEAQILKAELTRRRSVTAELEKTRKKQQEVVAKADREYTLMTAKHGAYIASSYEAHGFLYGDDAQLTDSASLELELLAPFAAGGVWRSTSDASQTQFAGFLWTLEDQIYSPATRNFDAAVAEAFCNGCQLTNPARTLGGALRFAELTNVSPILKQEAFGHLGGSIDLVMSLCDAPSAESDACSLNEGEAKRAQQAAAALTPLIAAARRQDFRGLAQITLNELLGTYDKPQSQMTDGEIYKAFFGQFAAFMLDRRNGDSEDEVMRIAFKKSANDALSRLGERGIPNAGTAHWYWVTASVARSYATAQELTGGRYRVGVDLLTARYTMPSFSNKPGFWGFGFSVFDVLRPFYEIANRPRDTTIRYPGWLVLNALSPKGFVWVALPQLTKKITVDGSLGVVPVVPSDCDTVNASDGEIEQCLKYDIRDEDGGFDVSKRLEFSVAISYLF